MPIEFMEHITRDIVRADRKDTYYVFGDNDLRKGFGGQAKEVRGEVNGVGIRTKHAPSNRRGAFWSDSTYEDNCNKIEADLVIIVFLLSMGKTVVFPTAGIGTGRAEMARKCPKTFRYLQNRLVDIFRKFGDTHD